MATYNLFPSDPPATTASTDTGSTITSTEFVVTATCWAVQIRWFRPNSTVTGTRTAQIWRQDSQTTGTAVGPQHVLPMPAAASWGTYDLPEAIELTPGRYRIAVTHSQGRFQRADSYYAAGNPGATAYVNGPITRVAGGNVSPSRQAAWLTSTTNVFPTTHSVSGFFDDIVVSDVKPAPAPPIGAKQDYVNQSFTNSAGTNSLYHMYAAGRTGATNGLVVQLHGDGAGEFASPTSGVLAEYNNVAKANNMLMLAPRSPDNTGIRTWWENVASPVWLLDLLDHVRSKYGIDENKIWFMGFSGGAEVQTYFLLSDYSNRIGNGGNIMLGGGGAAGLVLGRQPTAAFKTGQRLHWAVGALDTDDGTGWNALAAAQGGFDRYGTEGFTKRTFEVIPGKGHVASEGDGPRVLSEQLALAYPAVIRPSVKALDTDQDGITQAWFNARKAQGVELFITAGTPWSTDGLTTINTPRLAIREQFRMALQAGMKIGLYTRNPNHWAAGLEAAGPYLSQLQFFAIDVEPDPGQKVTQAQVNGVIAAGVRPIVYAGQWFWNSIHGTADTSFKQYPLWDTNESSTYDYTTWLNTPNFMTPAPLPFGGWNVEGNYRIGIQQRFDVVIDGILTDLNSFDAAFLVEKEPFVPPADPVPTDQRWFTDAEVSAAKTRGNNLVPNGDFELGQQSWPVTTGASVVTAARRNGAMGLRVQASAGIVYLLNNNVVQTYNGEQFYAEYWVRRTAGAASADVYAELGFVAQSNNGSAWNTPTIYGELTKGGGGFTPADIPTDRFVKVAAIITVDQPGASGIAFAPWVYANPRTYDIDDMFVARISNREIPAPPVEAPNKLRVYKLSAQATPQLNVRAYSMSVTAVPKVYKHLRAYQVSLEARIMPYALRKDGKWVQITTFVRKANRWR